MWHRNLFQIFILIVSFMFVLCCGGGDETSDLEIPSPARVAPYPPSPVIESILWDSDGVVSRAPGSDLWPVTWASDGNIYTAWGDGGGFGGTNEDGRVGLGFARIVGGPTNFIGQNVHGGKNAENPSQWPTSHIGKTAGLISVNGTLYAWLNMQDGTGSNVSRALIWSPDLGATWRQSSWVFPRGDGNFKPNTFLNFGRDYAGARDNYIYFYGGNEGEKGKGYMGRVIRDKLQDKNAFEYFAGLDAAGDATWSANINGRKPHFVNPHGPQGGGQVVYNSALARYIVSGSGGGGGKLGIFDGPEPWGPWTTVAYYDNWLGATPNSCGLLYSFPNKWTTSDGKTMWMVFSMHCDNKNKYHDRFNLIKATLILKAP